MKILESFAGDSKIAWQGDLRKGEGKTREGSLGALVSGRITTTELPPDWSGYKSLQYTVFNPTNSFRLGGVFILDEEALHSPEREFGDFVERNYCLAFPEGATHVVIDVDPIQTTQGSRMLALKKIREITLDVPVVDDAPCTLSNLRLSKMELLPDERSGIQPGDTIVHMRHMDLECYTFEPEKCKDSQEVQTLRTRLETQTARLQKLIKIARTAGKQTLYESIPILLSDLALDAKPLHPWHFSQTRKKANLSEAIAILEPIAQQLEDYLKGIIHEDDEDDSNLPVPFVKDVPLLRSLRIDGKAFVDSIGEPFLVCAMNYHATGRLMDFFSPNNHRQELYAVGGGSRYDIETSPVYDTFHASPKAKRVGWRGWCGHLIKDQWAMGGRKENVVICLEHKPILKAITQYNRMHANEWQGLPNLMYTILAYELTYMCYCEDSIRRFQKWLLSKHKTIKNLNACWGTCYKSFYEAKPPAAPDRGPAMDANRAAWYDWTDWNTRRFTDHLKWTKRDIKKIDPKVPTCAGGTHSMLSPSNSASGIDEELIINEVDDVILHEGGDLMSVDLLSALSDKPKPIVDPEHGNGSSAWLPNFLHGKTSVAHYWWPKQPSRCFPHSTMRSPQHGLAPLDETGEQLRIALDVRRLNLEISAFWDLPKEVALLYSKTNMLQVPPPLINGSTTPYLSTLRMVYDTARFLDAAPTFTSDRLLIQGKRKQKILILPGARHLRPEVFRAVHTYLANGGRVVVLPALPIADEYNRPAPYLAQWGIAVIRSHFPQIKGMGEYEQKYDQNFDRKVEFGAGKSAHAAVLDKDFFAGSVTSIATEGIFQEIRAEGAKVIAKDPDLGPVLTEKKIGKGLLYVFAGTPRAASLGLFLDRLYDLAGVERHLRVMDASGHRIDGVEARLIRRRLDDLVYVVNTNKNEVEFKIQTDRPVHKIRELRSLRYWPQPQGSIPGGRTMIFSLMEDPVIRVRAKAVEQKQGGKQ